MTDYVQLWLTIQRYEYKTTNKQHREGIQAAQSYTVLNLAGHATWTGAALSKYLSDPEGYVIWVAKKRLNLL